MANVLLGVTGSVAAIRTPDLFAALSASGHQVRVVATTAALYFFDPTQLDPSRPERNPDIVTLDEDEWPGRHQGRRWQRDDSVLHIELRRWADIFVIAPLDANTLAKLANGLSDNCLTCVWRAWDRSRPVVLAPAMNTLMWEHPLTMRHLQQLAEVPQGLTDLDEIISAINTSRIPLHIVAPQAKTLACGDVGVGAMADVQAIVNVVAAMLHGKPKQ
jgi:phosphopantothenoylcysteine decarboxylase